MADQSDEDVAPASVHGLEDVQLQALKLQQATLMQLQKLQPIGLAGGGLPLPETSALLSQAHLLQDGSPAGPAPTSKPPAAEAPDTERNFVCQICSKRFTHLWNLNRHMIHHTGERAHECFICNKRFMLASHLKQHMKTHAVYKPHRCIECGRAYAEERDLYIHMRTHFGERLHKCVVCNKSFIAAWNLNRHMKIHTGDKPYECSICQRRFMENYHLRDHMQTHGQDMDAKGTPNEPIKDEQSDDSNVSLGHGGRRELLPHCCVLCGKSFSHKRSFYRHLKTHADQKPHQCPECDKGFIEKARLKQHMKVHLSPGTGSYKCDFCEKVLTREFDLMVHLRTHTTDSVQQCYLCGKCFSSASAMRIHMSEHTSSAQWVCEQCGKRCTSEQQLTLHAQSHGRGEKQPHQCMQCGKCFVHEKALASHMKKQHATETHPEAPFPCRVCGQNFRHLYSLTIHSRKHTLQGSYICKVCHQTFTFQTNLVRHMTIAHGDDEETSLTCPICNITYKDTVKLAQHLHEHAGETPFLCTICGQTYDEADEFKIHQLSHSVNFEPYQCERCDKKFSQFKYLKSHFMQVHEDPEDSESPSEDSRPKIGDHVAGQSDTAKLNQNNRVQSAAAFSKPPVQDSAASNLSSEESDVQSDALTDKKSDDTSNERPCKRPTKDAYGGVEVSASYICGECGEDCVSEHELAAHKLAHNMECSDDKELQHSDATSVSITNDTGIHKSETSGLSSSGQVGQESLSSPQTNHVDGIVSTDATARGASPDKARPVSTADGDSRQVTSSQGPHPVPCLSKYFTPTEQHHLPQQQHESINKRQHLAVSDAAEHPVALNKEFIQSSNEALSNRSTGVTYSVNKAMYDANKVGHYSMDRDSSYTMVKSSDFSVNKESDYLMTKSSLFSSNDESSYANVSPPSLSMFSCPICGVQFASKDFLVKHMEDHAQRVSTEYSAKAQADRHNRPSPEYSSEKQLYKPLTSYGDTSVAPTQGHAGSYTDLRQAVSKPDYSHSHALSSHQRESPASLLCYVCGAHCDNEYVLACHLQFHQAAAPSSQVEKFRLSSPSGQSSQAYSLYQSMINFPSTSQYAADQS